MEFDLLLETATADMLLLDKKNREKRLIRGNIYIRRKQSVMGRVLQNSYPHTLTHTDTQTHIHITC